MAQGFTQPAAAPPKIGPTLAPAQVDPEKRREIEELDAVAKELKQPIEGIGDAPSLPPQGGTAYSEEDKKSFVRAILGSQPFAKPYTLFGGIRVTFVDAPAEAYGMLPTVIKADMTAGLAPKLGQDDDANELVARYLAALTVRDILGPNAKPIKAFKEPDLTKLNERVKELLELPRPLFLAVVNAAMDFDSLINGLVERAAVANFWQTGG